MAPQHSQALTTTSTSNITLQPGMAMNPSQPNQPQGGAPVTKDRCTIWQGILEFHEKSMPANPQSQRVSHTLPCTFSSILTNGDPDV